MSSLILEYNFTINNFTLYLPIFNGTVSLINWGDSTSNALRYHTYTSAGSYTVTIDGSGITDLNYEPNGGNDSPTGAIYLINCTSFGNIGLTTLRYAFFNCTLLVQVPSILPTGITDMSNMFNGASLFNQDISGWDVSSVTDMTNMFVSASEFNNGDSPLSWNTGTGTMNVQTMSGMFSSANSFNQDIGGWNVLSVTNMSNMFSDANSFNQDIGGWNVSSVTNMAGMFNYASSFNQDISAWDVSSVTDMTNMFGDADSFNNGDSGLTWGVNTSNVQTMGSMFSSAISFNQDISDWNVSSVLYMYDMFKNASSFNQDISGWNISSVRYLYNMFTGASSFNQDLSIWDISNVSYIDNIFDNSGLSISNYNNILNNWSSLPILNLLLGGSGLVYSPNGVNGHNTLFSKNCLFSDASISSDTIYKNSNFTFIVNTTDFNIFYQSPDSFTLTSNDLFPSSITIPFDNTNTTQTTLNYPNLMFTTIGNQTINLLNTDGSVDINYNIFVYDQTNIPCFLEDSKILTNKGYKPIQDLRKGDLVKTLKHDYKPIDIIGKREIYNPALDERIKDQLYKLTKDNFDEIFEPLIITGCHCILVDKFIDEEQKQKVIEVNKKIYVTDNKYRLPACAEPLASVYEITGTHTIYHLALENENYYTNYGIYANGLLVETCSKRYLRELSNMTLIT
jgi:hypothetical protein